MIIGFYTGNHSADTILVRAGWWLTRLVQRGPYRACTHVEAVHGYNPETKEFTIASASIRDGGIRVKKTVLTPGNWLLVDVPIFDIVQSSEWFNANAGRPYSLWGAVASAIPFLPYRGLFCSRAVAESVGLLGAADMTPQELAEICLSVGNDVTIQLLGDQKNG